MLANLRRTFAFLLILFGIPGFGLAASYALGFKLGMFGIALILACVSVLAAVAGCGLVLSVWLAALVCGERRERLVVVFRHLVRFVALILALLVLAQAAIVVCGVALLEIVLIHAVSIGLILPVAGGALYGAWEIVQSVFRAVRPAASPIVGVEVSEVDQPRLWHRVRTVATRIGARVPDHVVLGLLPNFFVTAAGIRLVGSKERLTGETMYLSASLMELVSEDEFNAVVGHELAHFFQADTAYSLRFQPVYQGLMQALEATDQGGRSHNLALLPARAVLGFTLSRFARAERAIGRTREIEADRIGASLSSSRAMVGALAKSAATDQAWQQVMVSSIAALNQRQPVDNIGRAFAGAGRQLIATVPGQTLIAAIAATHQPHPTDTHPSLAARAAALEVALDIDLLTLEAGVPRAIGLLENAEQIDLSLTESYGKYLVAQGTAKPASLIGRRTAFQMKRDTLAQRAAARKRALAGAGEPGGEQGDAAVEPSSSN